jgi:hypothetical protein
MNGCHFGDIMKLTEKNSVTDTTVKLILCDIMVALAAIGKPNAVMSEEALEEKNANLTGTGEKSQNGSMESNEHRRQLNEFNSMCPACVFPLVFFLGLARILCLESL